MVVPSHDRPLRLRWLLNALEAQTLDRARWEVVIAHDSQGSETDDLLTTHPLAAAGVLRKLRFEPGPGPAAKRNAGWRAARAETIVFTDDDCRPPADWLERMATAVARSPGAIVQGTTRPDPHEAHLMHAAPHARSQEIDPPTVWAQTCNIAYPRAVLEAADGFDETLPVASGEDTDLAVRAVGSGAEHVAAPEAVTYHAVETPLLPEALRSVWRWQHLAALVARHPSLRSSFTLGVFWKPTHPLLGLAVLGALLTRRQPVFALLALPWMRATWPAYGSTPRGYLRSASELPGRAVFDAVEVAALARGSVRYRTICL